MHQTSFHYTSHTAHNYFRFSNFQNVNNFLDYIHAIISLINRGKKKFEFLFLYLLSVLCSIF